MNKIVNFKKKVLAYLVIIMFMVVPNKNYSQVNLGWSKSSYRIHNGPFGGESSIKIKNKGSSFNIKYDGELVVSDDDKEVTSIADGGFLEIEKSSFGNKRRVLIEADREGNLTRKYFMGREEKNYNPEGKKWLGEILPDLVRSTTLASKSRVDRFYRQGGVDAVFNEVKRLESDYVRSAYFDHLIRKDITDQEKANVIEQAGQLISSDYYLSEVLNKHQSTLLTTKNIIDAYIKACESIASDYYKSRIVEKVARNSQIDSKQLSDLLEISRNIHSDYYLSQVLQEVAEKRDLNVENMNKLIELSDNIQSDYYKSELLSDLMRRQETTFNSFKSLIEAMHDISSDYYMHEALIGLLKSKPDMTDKELNDLLELSGKYIGSDYYLASFYEVLSEREFSESELIAIFNAIDHINSDYYLSEALQQFAKQAKLASEDVKSAYRSALKSIHSSTYYGNAAKAID